ncbi:hypothetical protein LVJ82_03475 [Vitreoscilla massiliensis]|uniref:Uncharacterized protein n=1 Tax=Vitreoscilla massiliensis TaxID=1689272 RepID=A0ABY4E6Q9_9NEIS|nr:hypothetical protein [Vitreoscilla massiliensis]UOO90063.1 hypothetical protein LVJ82_03475 [Vitreoscilla massiliensis]
MKTIAYVALMLAISPMAIASCLSALDSASLKQRLDNTGEMAYANVNVSFQCSAATAPYQKLIYANPKLKSLHVLNNRAVIYGYENATKTEVADSPAAIRATLKQQGDAAARCTSAECVCSAYSQSIDDMGGANFGRY